MSRPIEPYDAARDPADSHLCEAVGATLYCSPEKCPNGGPEARE